MLVMQAGKDTPEFHGGYELVLSGLMDGKPWSQAAAGGRKPLVFRQYARVDSEIAHPPEVVLKNVQVRVTDAKGAVRATHNLKL
jgi:hypothetical protein